MAEFHFVDLRGVRYSKDRDPDTCPICHHAAKPEEIDWSLTGRPNEPKPTLEIVYRCPRDRCGHLFIARYRITERDSFDSPHGRLGEFVLTALLPMTPPDPEVPAEVSAVAPSFKRVYAQAEAAEACGLDQVAGAGYRKALEFLIKEYCISTKPEAASHIKAAYLSNCINNYVDDERVRECARRATWLGNDETHFVRIWKDKDITDLKTLIRVTVHWIHGTILTERYKSEMHRPDGAV